MITVYSSDNKNNVVLEMSNIRGRYIKTDNVDFTFLFSKDVEVHGIRVKICWNRERMDKVDGIMQLHGDYEYTRSDGGRFASNREINEARKFFKKYKVFFAAMWEGFYISDTIQRYFEGSDDIDDVAKDIGINEYIDSVEDLEKYVREHHLFNMND